MSGSTWTTLRAAALALALGATSLVAAPTPAQANNDAARVIAGIVALGVVANSLDDNTPRVAHRHRQPNVTQRVHRPDVHYQRRPRAVVRQDRPRVRYYRRGRPRYQYYRH